MISTNPSLLEHPEATAALTCNSGISNGIELALFRARAAMLDGWDFTPEGVQTYISRETWQHDSAHLYSARVPDEDEIEDTALFFGD